MSVGSFDDKDKKKGASTTHRLWDDESEEDRKARKDTPLIAAVRAGDIDKVKDLISKKVNLNDSGSFMEKPLHVAINNGHTEIAKLLIESGANIYAEHLVFQFNPFIHPEKGRTRDSNFVTPLHLAVHEKNIDIIKALIAKGAYVSIPDKIGMTPLILAAMFGYKDIVEQLLIPTRSELLGPRADNVARYLGRALLVATETNHPEIVKKLIEAGANLQTTHGDKMTPLHIAVEDENVELVKILIEAGAKLDARDSTFEFGTYHADATPLHVAVERGNKEIVSLLLEAGANPKAGNMYGETPLALAKKLKNSEVVEVLAAFEAAKQEAAPKPLSAAGKPQDANKEPGSEPRTGSRPDKL